MATDLCLGRARTIQIVTDSQILAYILAGRAKHEEHTHGLTVDISTNMADTFLATNWGPRDATGDPVIWRRRDLNKEADYLANWAMDAEGDFWYYSGIKYTADSDLRLLGWSDGGCRNEQNVSAHAWILKGQRDDSSIFIVAACAKYYPVKARSSLEVECLAMRSLWDFVRDFVAGGVQACSPETPHASRKRRRCLAIRQFIM